jgi:excisionase family DNA binding protein
MSTDSADSHCSTLEAARRLGLAVRSVQMMVDRGELQAWKTPGGHRRILRASVDQWLAARGLGGAAAAEAEAPAAAPVPPRRAVERAGDPAMAALPGDAAGRPLRVLVIEDSVHFQNLIARLVQRVLPDAELHLADDGIAGLAQVGRLEPDVLLVDILLPGIDGAALITSLRSHPQFQRSRLIVVTSLDETQRAPYAFALEGVPVVHKPQLVLELPQRLAEAAARPVPGPESPPVSLAVETR